MQNKILVKLKDMEVEEVLERSIVNFGKSSHVILPQKHRGKEAIVIIKK
jgi:putative transposon-encoded protein